MKDITKIRYAHTFLAQCVDDSPTMEANYLHLAFTCSSNPPVALQSIIDDDMGLQELLDELGIHSLVHLKTHELYNERIPFVPDQYYKLNFSEDW